MGSTSVADRAALPIKSGPWTRATIAAEFGLRLRDVRLLDPSFANQVRTERDAGLQAAARREKFSVSFSKKNDAYEYVYVSRGGDGVF